jgi:hypothetical protein
MGNWLGRYGIWYRCSLYFMQPLLWILLLTSFISCTSESKKQPIVLRQPAALPPKDSLENYSLTKQKIISLRDSLRRIYNSANNNQAKAIVNSSENIFTHAVIDKLIAHWYGTAWDFNGITEEPGKGQIACGYFVTTILRDAGFKVQRIKLAQSPASIIIEKVAGKNAIRHFGLKSVKYVDSVVKSMGEGLYVVGLDFHVGFLYNDGVGVYFIHSNYIRRQGVVKELIQQSAAFANSKYRLVGKITRESITKNWLQ